MKALIIFLFALAIASQCLAKTLKEEEEIVHKLKEHFQLAKDKSTNPILMERMCLGSKSTFEKVKEKLGMSSEEHYIVELFLDKLEMKKDQHHIKLLRDFLYESIPVVPLEKKTLVQKIKDSLGIGGHSWQTKVSELIEKNFIEWKELAEETRDEIDRKKDKVTETYEPLENYVKHRMFPKAESIPEKAETIKKSASDEAKKAKDMLSELKMKAEDQLEKMEEGASEKKFQVKEKMQDIKEKVKGRAEDIKVSAKEKVEQATEKLEEVNEKAKDTTEDIKEKIQVVKEKASEKLADMKEKAGEYVGELKEKIPEKMEDMKEKMYEAKGQAGGKIERAKEWTGEKVHELKEKAKDQLESAKERTAEILEQYKEKGAKKVSELKEKAAEKVGEVKEKISETGELAKDVWEEKKMEMKEKWDEKKEQIKKSLSDMKGVAESTLESLASVTELTDHLKLNEDEKLTLLILQRRLGKSGILTIGEFIDYYGPQTENYMLLSPSEKALVDKITNHFLSIREKPYVDEFKKNIGVDKTWTEKLAEKVSEKVDDIKEKTGHMKDTFKQSIGLSKGKDSYQRKVEL